MSYDVLLLSMSGYFDFSSGLVNNRNRSVWQELERRSDIRRILFVDFLPFNPKTALKVYVKAGIYRHPFHLSRLRKVSEKTFVYSTVESFFGRKFFMEHFQKAIQQCGLGRDSSTIVWSYNPLNLRGWLDIPASVRVFDTVDNWATHSNFQLQRDLLRHNYQLIDKNADVIFTVSESLKNIYDHKEKVHWIPNGVDTHHFKPKEDYTAPQLLQGISRPLIGYVGVIQDRLDLELMEYLAKKYLRYSWVLVGPTWPVFLRRLRPRAPEIQRLNRYPNVHFLGVQPHAFVPDLVQSFDVAIIPHRLNAFTGSMNPLKLYEYLALGKPVVSTPVAGLEKFRDCVYVGSGPKVFGEQIERALRENSPQKMKERIHSIQHTAWGERVSEMMAHIVDVFGKRA